MQDTEDNRVAHLGMIQDIIKRMASNSFFLKGWSVTLVAALGALAVKDGGEEYAYLPLFPALVFWGLDAYYIRQEKLFRKLWDEVRSTPSGSMGERMLSMDTKPDTGLVRPWFAAMFNPTLVLFHGAILTAIVILIILLTLDNGGN